MTQYTGPGHTVSTTLHTTLSMQGPPIHSWVHEAWAWGANPMMLAAPRDAARRTTRLRISASSTLRCLPPSLRLGERAQDGRDEIQHVAQDVLDAARLAVEDPDRGARRLRLGREPDDARGAQRRRQENDWLAHAL